MTKISPKVKAAALSAVVASTAVVAYASNEVSKKDTEQSVDTANLIVEKIGKDRVKLSVDNVENAVKAFQLSLKIEGNVEFNDDDIKWLTAIDNKDEKNADKPVETDYVLSKDKKEIDIFVASNSELEKKGRVLEICEINLKQTGLKSNSSYKIVPNTKDGKVAYKSIDTNNNQLEEAKMAYDDTALSLNTAPTIELKDLANENVTVDAVNKIIKVKEGYDFNTNAKSFVEVNDEDEEISEDRITVTEVNTKKSGTYNVEYTVKDSNNETTKLDVKVLVEPEVWKEAPTLTGVPDETIELTTGDIFNPLMPDGKTQVTAKDARDNAIDVEFTQDFNLEQEGEYTITYTAKDRYNNTVSKDMTLKVVQNEAPQIIGADDVIINKGTEFDPKQDVRVEDADSDVTIEDLEVTGNVNTEVANVYKLTYKVSDGKNTTTKVRTVTVNDAPQINGDLSYIILKNGQELNDNDLLGRIEVSDDLDTDITATVDKSELKPSVDGVYTVKVKATDKNNLTTEKEVTVIVTSKSVVDLPESGEGLSKDDSIKKEVVEASAISKINEELSALTKEYDVELTKSTVLEDTVYSIKVSTKPVAIIDDKEEWFVDIKVPKDINDSTGGIVITQHEAVKISSIKINGYSSPLEVGDTIKLTTEINPEDAENKDLIWAFNKEHIKLTPSSDGQSATITAVAEGISKVRAMASDGSEVHAEILVQVGEKKPEDTQKPEIIYNGKKEIKIANGMKFKVPTVTATDNVDVFTEVTTTILNSKGEVIKEIDTTVAGEYTIKYTTQDSAGNEAELTIKVTVDEAITGVTVGKGDATTQEKALEMKSENIDGLKELVSAIEKEFEAETIDKPVIDKNKGTATYTIKLSKKQGAISRLFNSNKNVETYYIKVTVENKAEFTDILDKFNKDGSITNPPVEPPVKPPVDKEAPVLEYSGKTDITLANGMKFELPVVNATDNVDKDLTVTTTILKDGKKVTKIDTKVAGKYEVKYTTQDKAGNKAELIINVVVKEAISGVVVGDGDATTESTALKIESKDVAGLKELVDAMQKGFEAETTGAPVISGNKATYTIKLSKKQGLISRLFNVNKNTETYYVKVTVENKAEFTNILDKLNADGSITNPPVTPSVPETTVTKLIGSDRFETAVKISKEGWTTSNNVVIVNGNDENFVDGLTATPLASAKNAPILLSKGDTLPQDTIDEIKRLKASNVIVIGGETAMPESIVDQIKAINSGINVQRIGGLTRVETSVNIAKEIDKSNDITRLYIGGFDGEADALSISSVAGREKAPIILTKKDGLDKNNYEYLKSEKIVDGYFIGGDKKISDKAIAQINKITSKDVSKNRIAGARRQETNAKVIEKFYKDTQLDGVVVAKDLELVDALTVGPLAAKNDMPVVIATNSLNKAQENVLKTKKSPKIYETGGGIKSSVIDTLKKLVNNKK